MATAMATIKAMAMATATAMALATAMATATATAMATATATAVDIGLVESPFQHSCLKHLQDCVVNGD